MIKEITKEWLEEKRACRSGIIDWEKEVNHETIATIKRNIERNPSQANWIITKIMTAEQNKKYALFAALLVFPLWQDKHPEQATIWRKWADNLNAYDDNDNSNAANAAYAVTASAAYAVNTAAYAVNTAAYAAAYAANAANTANAAVGNATAYAARATAANAAAAAKAAAAASDIAKETLIKILKYGLYLLLEEEEINK
jgi:hypothetical protein